MVKKSEKKSHYTLQFWLLCLSSVFFMASFNMIIPELPDFLTKMGGGEYKGYIISLFTLTAGLSRPFSGKLADTIGRVPVMIVGALVSLICGAVYPFFLSVGAFFVLRFIHGFATGFKPTGTTAYLADIIPLEKRGQAMGILGVFGSIGMAMGPVLGSYIATYFSLEMMFYSSSFMAFLSILTLYRMKETLEVKQKFGLSLFKVSRADFFEPLVIAPALIMFLAAYSFGTILTVVPDLCAYTGIRNKGFFFSVFVFSTVIMRLIAGSFSDKMGREKTLIIGLALLLLGMLFISP